MASTEQIETAARDLGKLLAEHDAAKTLTKATEALDKDVDTQRLMTDFNRLIQTLSEKQAGGQPIEVADKRQLEDLQTQIAMNLVVRQLQQAQVDYMDLMRKIVSEIEQQATPTDQVTPPGPSGAAAGAGPAPGGPGGAGPIIGG